MTAAADPERARPAIDSLARQTGFPADAVVALHRALVAGGGGMAQFDHPAFGGAGQWMRGGMLMTSDPSDHALRARIEQLCEALARSMTTDEAVRGSFQSQRQGSDVPGSTPRADARWWPSAFGAPETSGAQDGLRYAWFRAHRRLAVDDAGRVTVYDTADHDIGGVSQRQGGERSLAFTSQHGPVELARLAVVDAGAPAGGGRSAEDAHRAEDAPVPAGTSDPFDALERLATLHARGIVDDAEFRAKKAELLARI